MKSSILTDNERTLIKEYLETGKRLEGFKVLLHRVRKNPIDAQTVNEDLELINQLLKKAGDSPQE